MGDAIRAVSIGGGTGQPQTIRALRLMGARIDSVVAMADDGGSTGLLREREHVVPPGDVRKCLSALAADPDAPLARAFAHRFASIDDHALGNLLLVALAKETDSFIDATRACESLLGCVGRVHPSTLDFVSLSGRTVEGDVVHGQARISYGAAPYESVWLDQEDVHANCDAVDAILAADLVVLGPGSLFTSIMPNILVPEIRDALRDTRAKRVFVAPKIDSLGETSGFSVADHVRALLACGLDGAIDVVLVHAPSRDEFVYPYEPYAWKRAAIDAIAAGDAAGGGVVSREDIERAKDAPFGPIRIDAGDGSWLDSAVPCVLARDFTGAGSPAVHDVRRLADALLEVVG